MVIKISVRLDEPLKMKTKLKVDDNGPITTLPFESLTVQARPNDPEGNYFEIKLNTPGNQPQQLQKLKQNGTIQKIWQKLFNHQPQRKPDLTGQHIMMTKGQQCPHNAVAQGGIVDVETEETKKETSEPNGGK